MKGVDRAGMSLFLTFFAALLLLGSLSAAKSPPVSGCSMGGSMDGSLPDDHEKMDCCTPDCTMASAAALPGSVPLCALVIGPDRDLTWIKAADRLPSVVLHSDDPPPRTYFS